MKLYLKHSVLLLSAILMLISENVFSQNVISQGNTKKSVAYKANYQHRASNHIAYHSFEIRGGSLWAWGRNSSGQLGDGTTVDKYSIFQIGTGNNWVSVYAGIFHTLGSKIRRLALGLGS